MWAWLLFALLLLPLSAAAQTGGVNGAPGAPVITMTKYGTAALEWNAPSTNTDGSALTDLGTYRIYYGPTATGCPGIGYKQTVPAPKPNPTAGDLMQATVSGLLWGTAYQFQVTAVDTQNNESACSNTATGAPTQ